jgi:DNA-binding transcriptional MerR regulator
MRTYSTREAAQKLGMDRITLQRYIKKGLRVPALRSFGGGEFRIWTERDLGQARKHLSKMKDGRRKRKRRKK